MVATLARPENSPRPKLGPGSTITHYPKHVLGDVGALGLCGEPVVGIFRWSRTHEFVNCPKCRAALGLEPPIEIQDALLDRLVDHHRPFGFGR